MSNTHSRKHSNSHQSGSRQGSHASTNRTNNTQNEEANSSEGRIDRIERVLETFVNHVAREPIHAGTSTLDQYRRQQPPVFKGRIEDDPSIAEYWMGQTEKLLRHLRYDDADKVNCATFMLEDEAGRWWQTTQRALQTRNITWGRFKKLFTAKYLPRSWKERKVWEFMQLKQTRDMTVAQYDAKFVQLIKYVPMYETDEWQKAQKFVSGLKAELQQALSTWELSTYETALHKALTTERNMLRVQYTKMEETSNKRNDNRSQPIRRDTETLRRCSQCNQFHPEGECAYNLPHCYVCGKE